VESVPAIFLKARSNDLLCFQDLFFMMEFLLFQALDEYPFPTAFFFLKHEWMNEKIVFFDSFMYLFENVLNGFWI